MNNDNQLKKRGQLVRNLGRHREMMPGYLVERVQKCGKPSCWCANQEGGHIRYQLTVRLGGKTKTYHVPMSMVEEVRKLVEHRLSFEEAVQKILAINLERYLKRKEEAAGDERKRKGKRKT